MTRDEITAALTQIFQKVFEAPNLTVTEELTANDIEKWDSLTNIIMVDEVEAHFGVRFKLKEIMGLRNVGDLISVIERYKA